MTTAQKRILSTQIKPLISQALFDLLKDPDLGLELSARAKKRLGAAKKYTGKTIALSEIRKNYY